MLAVAGYYDGVAVQPLGNLVAKPNQRVMITVMDDFIRPEEACERPRNGRSNFLSLAGHIDIDESAVAELREGSRL